MEITVNGERRQVRSPLTIAELLAELGLDAGRVAVEHNRRLVKRNELDQIAISEGDELEIVHFVGGGQSFSLRRQSIGPAARFYFV